MHGQMRNAYKIFVGIIEVNRIEHLGDLGVDGGSERNRVYGFGLIYTSSGWDPLTDSCEYCNEISSSIKGVNFLD
jgi:hypothetical protein